MAGSTEAVLEADGGAKLEDDNIYGYIMMWLRVTAVFS